jgi:acetyl esterase/lipase
VAWAARRAGISTRAWLIMAAMRRRQDRSGTLDSFHERLREDRRNGPALPSDAVRERHQVADDTVGTHRAFRVRPAGGVEQAGQGQAGQEPVGQEQAGRPILYLHGGAYVFDLMEPHWSGLTAIADGTGREVVALLYPLAPEKTVEDGLAAAEAAYVALVAESGGAGVTLAGDSAGGGLALALAHRLREAGHPMPDRMLLFFPWLDATIGDPSQPELAEKDPLLTIPSLREAGRMWAGSLDPADPRVSPLFGDHRDLPPILVQIGTHDLLLADARRFADRCPTAQVVEYPGMFHGWVVSPVPEGRAAMEQAGRFLRGEAA